ncbi:MAG: spondin domain-containing protein [Planctomycetales bacterium]|nr:spondin domain-containing protein [Planctomycetales bacterium]
MKLAYLSSLAIAGCVLGGIGPASAQIMSTDTPSTPHDIRVTITNEGNSSFTLTPLWFAFQDGTFDFFDAGMPASMSLENLAEDGIVDGLVNDFNMSGVPGNRQGLVLQPQGFPGAPVIEPGETGTAYITALNPADYRYLSFASMVIPSNDTFIGNDDPTAYQVFTAAGEINDPSGAYTIQIFGSDVWDAGTEENLGDGAAFSTIGGTATDTVGGSVGAAGDLSEFLNTTTPAQTTITDLIGSGELLATITISQVPEPTGSVLLLLGLVGGLGWRRHSAQP